MSEPAEQGAYFQYADIAVPSNSRVSEDADDWVLQTSSQPGAGECSWLDRALLHERLREELRAEHRSLTDRQLDAIATMTVELRQVRIRLGSVSDLVRAATSPSP